MRRLFLVSLVWMAWMVGPVQPLAKDFRMTNGDLIQGEPVSFTEEGVVFKLDIGGFSPVRKWPKFTQEALKELAKDPRGTRFAEAFIDTPPEVLEAAKKPREIKVNPVEGALPRYEKVPFLTAWTTPAALLVLLALYGANLYAGYEVARFRNRPAGLVCAVSALLPVVGPLVFLSLPALDEHGHEIHADGGHEHDLVADAPPAVVEAQAPAAAAAAPRSGGLGVAKHEKAAGGGAEQGTFKRGDFTFNRRFVETKFASFFRVVPSEAEKDLVLVIRTGKQEYVGKRVSRITGNEMHVTLLRGGTEVAVAFEDVVEFQVRHKDAK